METLLIPAEVVTVAEVHQLGEPYAQFQTLPMKQKRRHIFSTTFSTSFTIYPCPHGLIQRNDKTHTMQVIRWEHIKEFYAHSWQEVEGSSEDGVISRWTRCSFNLNCTDGTSFRFVGISDSLILRRLIEKALTASQLPSVIETYNTGKSVTFGDLTLTQVGVSNGEYTFTWDKILCIDFAGDAIRVRGFQWDLSFGVPASTTPNVCVLEAFIRYLDRQGKTDLPSHANLSTTEKRFSRKAHRLLRQNEP
jgi:hypothetical protein